MYRSWKLECAEGPAENVLVSDTTKLPQILAHTGFELEEISVNAVNINAEKNQ